MPKIEHKNIKKGDVWLIENISAIGHMQNGKRPHVVVTQVTGETVTVAPCTSVQKKFTKNLHLSVRNFSVSEVAEK